MENTELKILGCNLVKRCPRDWSELDPTGHDHVRRCNACDELVYLCHSDEELRHHASRRHCAAVEPAIADTDGMAVMGRFVEGAYAGPFLSLWLVSTYSLGDAQLEFIARLAGLELPIIRLRSLFCNGEPHLVARGLHPDRAESLHARMRERQIVCSVTVDQP